MRMTWIRMVSVVLSIVVGATAGAADDNVTSVMMVEVPVQVVSRDGTPIEGLERESFVLYDRRKKRQIIGFEQIDLREESARALPLAARRHVLFLFDLASSDPISIGRARESILGILDGKLHAQDKVALATYSSARGMRLLADFTTDHAAVAEALSTMVEAEGLGQVTRVGASDLSSGRELTGPGGGDFGGDASIAEGLQRSAGAVDRNREADTLAEISALEGLADALALLDGRKQVLFLSQGLDLQLPSLAMADPAASLDRMTGQSLVSGTDPGFGSSRLQNDSEAMIERFRRADCAIYAIDLSYQKRSTGPGSDSRRSSLVAMARGTGGEFYSNFNRIDGAVERMIERTNVTYLLAFQPDDLEGDGDFHKLKIKLKNVSGRPRVSHRAGYYDRLPELLETSELYPPVATLPEQGVDRQEPSQVAIELLAVSTAAVRGGRGVPVMLRIPGADALEVAENSITGFEVIIEARAEDGVTASVYETFGLNVDEIRSQLEGSGVLFYAHFDLAPGEHEIRAQLVMGAEGRRGQAVARVSVPDSDHADPSVSVPLFPDPLQRWAMRRQSRSEGEGPLPFPFMVRGEPFLPAVMPEIHGSKASSFCLLAAGIEGAELALTGEISGRGGEAPRPADVTFLRRTGGGLDGIDCLLAELHPQSLAAGDYLLRVMVADSISGERLAESEIPVTVATRSEQLSGMQGFPQVEPGAREEDIARIDQKRVAREYRELLAMLAEGRGEEAGLALIRLEESVVPENRPVPQALLKIEVKIGHSLARERAGSLVPILGLHSDAYETYLSSGRLMMAVHSRWVVTQLVERYAKLAKDGESQELVARVIARLAADVAQAGAHTAAHRLFERALGLDPGNEAAALGFGALLEKQGNCEHMVEVLTSYRDGGGEGYEAQLRLAMGLSRIGRVAEAEGLLADLASGPGPEEAWMSSITYQELGKLLMAGDHLEEASELFARGVAERPEDQALAILLTFAQSRERRAGGATHLVNHLKRGAASESPRYRYNLWPARAFATNRHILAEKAELHLGDLDQALGPRSGGQAF